MLNLTNSRLKNHDTGRGEGVKVREAIQLPKLFGTKKIGVRNYIIYIYIYIYIYKYFQKTFQKRAILGNFFIISNVP